MKNKFLVLKHEDIDKVLEESSYIGNYLDDLSSGIREIRENEGRNTNPKYVVINMDEPYIDKIIDIMRDNGHWED